MIFFIYRIFYKDIILIFLYIRFELFFFRSHDIDNITNNFMLTRMLFLPYLSLLRNDLNFLLLAFSKETILQIIYNFFIALAQNLSDKQYQQALNILF